MQDLIRSMQDSRHLTVFTGAGVSTLSGIRDFRGPDGIGREMDAESIFDIDEFRADPSLYYRHAAEFIYALDEREPSLVHTECARLEALGVVKAVITQNIDMLHHRAGSRRVIELHGSPRRHRCLGCGATTDFAGVRETARRGEVPRCRDCGGAFKPDITFYGEMLDPASLDAAAAEAERSDLMLVLGSTLVVQPAASIPLLTLRAGGRVAIVNDGATPLDGMACFRHDDLRTCFAAIAAAFPDPAGF